MRPTMEQVYLDFAHVVARRSVCERRTQVGAVITDWKNTNVVAIGYNGPARGLDHFCLDNTDGKPGSCTCVHAEVNALIKAPYDRGPLRMYTTHSPCPSCARLILNSKVQHVVYREQYRLTEGLDILIQGEVTYEQL